MPRSYWLVKSEPDKYSWDDFVQDGSTYWEGVRNPEARNSLRKLKKGDLALYYHSNRGKEVVGIARVTGESYPDPTSDDPSWVVVDLEPVQPFVRPVPLAEIRTEPQLADIALVRRSRLSVMPLRRADFDRILRIGETKLQKS